MADAAKIELLKKQRSAFKGQLTNFKSHLDKATSIGGFESLLNRLQTISKKYDGAQSQLEVIDETTLVDRNSFDEDYLNLETILRDKIHNIKKSEDTSFATSFHNASFHEPLSPSSVTTGIRLPEITLPTFNGLESDWLGFRDVFVDLIHSKNLESTVKFLYLISSTRNGRAYNLIESLPVTAANYEIAWSALCDHYNNEVSIKRFHTRELYEIKSPQENSSKALQYFVDKIVKHVGALKSLKVQVSEWDLLLVHHLTQRLDNSSRIFIVKNTKPNVALALPSMIELLRSRIRILDAPTANSSSSSSRAQKHHSSMSLNVSSISKSSVHTDRCFYCGLNHTLPYCSLFSSDKMNPKSRFHFVKDRRLCGNCLLERHPISQCNHPPCSKCSLKHHQLLHFPPNDMAITQLPSDSPNGQVSNQLTKAHTVSASHPTIETNCAASLERNVPALTTSNHSKNVILIGTALIHAVANNGTKLLCRALLDSGSTLNFVTESTCKMLKMRQYPTSKTISGIAATKTLIKNKIYLTITSRTSDFSVHLKFYVLPKITDNLPSINIPFIPESLPNDIDLADPYFNVPDRIDLLLGAEIYHRLFNGSSLKIHTELPPLHNSEFGYVISGTSSMKVHGYEHSKSSTVLCSISTLETQVKQFWEIEHMPAKPLWSKEETESEAHYKANFHRTSEGRYCVGLPTKPNVSLLGSSFQSAYRQFLALENRLQGNPDVYAQYRDFMEEYISLGHMSAAMCHDDKGSYYLPHHYVLKETSSTTKLRVVFNASSKTSSHISLNECLMVGPTIQPDLISTILRFRRHVVALSGDIAKMYRQILVNQDQRHLQCILWRKHPSEQLQRYTLNTVTYGTACAPFLATRTLRQLSIDDQTKFPSVAEILDREFYVDDLLSGAATINDARQLKSDITELLRLGGFELRKFVSNISCLSSDDQSTSPVVLVLGLLWDTISDSFEVRFNKVPLSISNSKRKILSEICQLFDPLGFCAPIIITAKLVMQNIWMLQGTNWDDVLPSNIIHHWSKFKQELHELHRVSIPRLITSTNQEGLELHGFCDASEKAYGCVLYTRSLSKSNHYHIALLCSKSRVAPLTKQTIPRLELCAAMLLAEVVHKVLSIMENTFNAIFLWTDSKVTLYRIMSEPYKYNTFVANRLTKIQELTVITDWRYVPTADNPADLVSRGLMPSQFLSSSIWWDGPQFLKYSSTVWPPCDQNQWSQDQTNLELRKISLPSLLQNPIDNQFIFDRFENLSRLLRVTAFMLRFINRTRYKDNIENSLSDDLQPVELQTATTTLIKIVQRLNFSEELKTLTRKQEISVKSNLRSLAPFLDDSGVLRVGGRLTHAALTYDQKHPILLPRDHIFSVMLARHEHLRLLHAEPQALLYSLRQAYWIIGGRGLCKQIVHLCVRCSHVKPVIRHQIMGDLPSERVNRVSRAFTVVGIDFCGPFYFIHASRAKVKNKCYICLFICFTTKAVHLDIVINATSESFIACLKRFVSRRELCSRIFSDNATNFIGARNELKELKSLLFSQSCQDHIRHFCLSHNIEWSTIPPRSPHFGGLWESAIKSDKHHLKRVMGTSCLTLEEFLTLTTQIEACLNSRPMLPMSNDPSDLTALSPSHFIIGAPLTSIPEPSLLDLTSNKLSRFQRIQQLKQSFWDRWHCEYLTELQQRSKWQQGLFQYQVGMLVLLHDDNQPPLQWIMGRITDLHPGKDGVVRVVSIKTSHSQLKRATNRISVLPIPIEQ